MSWTTPEQLRTQLARLWDSGALLRPLAGAEPLFPLRLVLKSPSSADLTVQFEAVRGWIAELSALPWLRLEWETLRHRVQGTQRLPREAWIDTAQDAFALLEREAEAQAFADMVEETRARLPLLLPWLAQRPLRALELAGAWPRLLAVVEWLQRRPRPGIYLREVDIPRVHSKFIEAHRGVLAELLDLTLPAGAIADDYGGIAQFAPRYGFRDKPARLRLRVLDSRISPLAGAGLPDLMLDADSFATMEIAAEQVFITENETNFLAFPPQPLAIVIFGAGYGWATLARAHWLARCSLHYWGDIDTHGLAILDQLRSHFPQTRSLLMDEQTLDAHRDHWGEEADPVRHELPRLDAAEQALFRRLLSNGQGPALRLEQERVGYEWLRSALRRLGQG
jgi:hypothetical protein